MLVRIYAKLQDIDNQRELNRSPGLRQQGAIKCSAALPDIICIKGSGCCSGTAVTNTRLKILRIKNIRHAKPQADAGRKEIGVGDVCIKRKVWCYRAYGIAGNGDALSDKASAQRDVEIVGNVAVRADINFVVGKVANAPYGVTDLTIDDLHLNGAGYRILVYTLRVFYVSKDE